MPAGSSVGEPTAVAAQSAPTLNASWIGLPPSRPWIRPGNENIPGPRAVHHVGRHGGNIDDAGWAVSGGAARAIGHDHPPQRVAGKALGIGQGIGKFPLGSYAPPS